MLRECDEVRQHPGEGRRRWFTDPDFDLIVWYGPGPETGEITGFQLCYDKRTAEHALTWRRTGGVTHHEIDDGQALPQQHRSPILIPDGPIPAVALRDRFATAARDIDPVVAGLVRRVLEDLADVVGHGQH
jgi:hypothetical protein